MAVVAIIAALEVLGRALASESVKMAISRTSELFSTFSNVEESMNNLSSELRVMKEFLAEINIHDQSNRPLAAWIGEVQNLANRIKDSSDEFIYLVGNENFGGIQFYVKRIFKKTKSLTNLKRIACQLQAEERSLKNLAKMKVRWVLPTNTGLGQNSYPTNEYAQRQAVSAHFIDEGEIVGLEEDRLRLASWLNSEDPLLVVISVWGMGGIGKTTLVTNVFKRERKTFDCHAWISIFQTYTICHLLRNLISEICASEKNVPIDTTTMDIRGLKETLQDLLKEKRYLIVLDDAWEPQVFHDIHDVLVDRHRGSRIIITTRIADVAFLAEESYRLELKHLSDAESWNLFCRKAFHLERDHTCPSHLENLARQLVLKCDGLPLALVSIGGVLSLCEKTEFDWQQIHKQLSWQLENNSRFYPMRNILNLSFNYLPRHLKNCFLYCCMFPEDHLLARKKLVRLWIAEGFIEQRGESTLEEVAEGYLIELIHRSLLQLVKKNFIGRVKRCRMHDILREFAISVYRKENFTLLHGDNKPINIDTSTRRLSVIKNSTNVREYIHLPQLRSFISFDPNIHSSPLLLSILKSRYLTVLDLQGIPIETIPETIGDLFNLHYLCLRDTMVKILPKSIRKLSNLQTLDIFNSKITVLPDGITKLAKLRHLFVSMGISIHFPKGLFYLKDLQTILGIESNIDAVKESGNLTQMRSFRIWNVKESHSSELCTSLSKMPFLSYLHIIASNRNELLHLENLYPWPPQLLKLAIRGRLKENALESQLIQISWRNLPNLWLGMSQLSNDPLPSLSQFENLKWLYLEDTYQGQQLSFRTSWFPKLNQLALVGMHNLLKVEMEKGTMVSLDELWLLDLEQLDEIPKGIEHITALTKMFCRYLPATFGGLVIGHQKLFHFKCYVSEPRPIYM